MVENILKNVSEVMVGKEQVTKLLVAAMLAGGHVLLEDVPGVGKTTMVKAIAGSVDCDFKRIQFTPDTMPSDITGMSMYNYEKHRFEYTTGAIMSNLILADEINRTSPKTQASLLEAMEEGKVTVDGNTYELPQPFMVIATQNPATNKGTYYLPESQLDRFMIKLNMGYPSLEEEVIIAKRMISGVHVDNIKPVIDKTKLLTLKEEAQKVFIDDKLIEYAALIVDETRRHDKVLQGVSPRALLAWIKFTKAYCYIEGRDFVKPDDLKLLAPYVLGHRLVVVKRISAGFESEQEIIEDILRKVKVPVGK